MSQHLPQVSIGMPVYNGEKFIREAIDSLLAQTFTDFELIISDNASTDGTELICREYAARDKRIRYDRNPKNIGAANNFNKVLELSRGELFMWAAHDDWWAPTYISSCVGKLSEHQDAILCYSGQSIRDAQNNLVRVPFKIVAPQTATFFGRYSDTCFRNWGLIYSVIRKSSLIAKTPMANFALAEGVLVASLSLQGFFVGIPDHLFIKRENKHWDRISKIQTYQIDGPLETFFKVDLMFLYVMTKYIREAVLKSSLKKREKLLCSLITIRNYLGMKFLRLHRVRVLYHRITQTPSF